MIFERERLLFFDWHVVESSENTQLTLNPPTKKGPCLFIDREWELDGARAYSVLEWNGEFRLYYEINPGGDRVCFALAASRDGINWEKPNLGAVSFNGSSSNNIVDVQGEYVGGACVFVDPTGPDDHRFKLLGHNPHEGMFLLTSPDGLCFKRQTGCLLAHNPDSLVSAFYDPRVGKYRVYIRAWNRERPIEQVPGSRTITMAELDTLFEPFPVDPNPPDPWPQKPPKKVFGDTEVSVMRRLNREIVPYVIAPDEQDPPLADLYQSAAIHYMPEVYFAFPTLYYHYPGPPEGFINDGILDIQFAASRDGRVWQRDLRGSYVRLDLPDGHCTKLLHLITGIVPWKHIMSQYYVGGSRTHGQGRKPGVAKPKEPTNRSGKPFCHRLEQRLDGFVSADSAYMGGHLITKPFISGSRLLLNIDTSASGVASAALLDEQGKEIQGFTLDECDRIQGNDTQYEVTWNHGADLSRIRGHAVRLHLRSRSTKLFAVTTTD
ncbi:MAG TPA: hypothetical protein PKH07_05070 [bacterium]|nr:hypothetical protein [bacterium]